MNFWDIIKLIGKLLGIYLKTKQSEADRQQALIDALQIAQVKPSLALGISDNVQRLRADLETKIKAELEEMNGVK